MKNSILLLSFLLSLFSTNSSYAENFTDEALEAKFDATPSLCPEFDHSKKALLYLDLDVSYPELIAAKKAACEQGLRFIAAPGEEISKKLMPAKEKIANLYATYLNYIISHHCVHENDALDGKDCDQRKKHELKGIYDKKLNELHDQSLNNAYDPFSVITRTAQELNKEDTKITHLVISGHHYSNLYAGVFTGEFSEYSIIRFAKENPTFFNQLQFLALWGCSGVTNEIIESWRDSAPSLKMIVGYYGQAPSSIRSVSQLYLYQSIIKQNELMNLTDKNTLKSAIANLPGVSGTYAGFYLHTLDGKDYFYYASDRERARFELLRDQFRCINFNERFQSSYQPQILRYLSGEDLIPADKQGMPLYRAYYDIQENFDCLDRSIYGRSFAVGRVGLLRFFESGFKYNIEQSARQYFQNLSTLIQTSMIQNPNDLSLKNIKTLLKAQTINQFIITHPRRDIIELSRQLELLMENPSRPSAFHKNDTAVRASLFYIKNSLVDLNLSCTPDMLKWHEFVPGRTLTFRCDFY